MSTDDMVSQEQFKELRSFVQKIGSDMEDVKGALLGSKKYGQKGYVHRLEDVETKVHEHEDFKKKMTWVGVGMATAGGSLGALVMKLILDVL